MICQEVRPAGARIDAFPGSSAPGATAGHSLRLASIMVTLSGESLETAESSVMHTLGRGLVSYWVPEPADTTRRCLTTPC